MVAPQRKKIKTHQEFCSKLSEMTYSQKQRCTIKDYSSLEKYHEERSKKLCKYYSALPLTFIISCLILRDGQCLVTVP